METGAPTCHAPIHVLQVHFYFVVLLHLSSPENIACISTLLIPKYHEGVYFRWTSYLNWLVFSIDLWVENLILNRTVKKVVGVSFANPWSIVLKWPAVCCIAFTSLPLRASTPYLTAYITTALHWKRLHRKLVAVHYNLRIRKTGAMKIEVNVHGTRSSHFDYEKVTYVTKGPWRAYAPAFWSKNKRLSFKFF